MANTIDLQTVPVRCATKGGDPYVYVDPANSGTRDGVAELRFEVDATSCSGITLTEVLPGENCKVVSHEVSRDGQAIEAHIDYDQAGDETTSLTYQLRYKDASGTLRQAYGGTPQGAVQDEVTSGFGLAAGPNPPPKVEFP